MKTSYEDSESVACDDPTHEAEETVPSNSSTFLIGSEDFYSKYDERNEGAALRECRAISEDVVSCEDVSVSLDTIVSGSESTTCDDVTVFHEAESTSSEEVSAFQDIFAMCKPQRNLIAREDVQSLRDKPSISEVRLDTMQDVPIYELVSPETSFRTIEVINRGQNWSDSLVSLPVESACEPVSEMYYTASSEVSLLSDTEIPMCTEKANGGDPTDGKEAPDDRKDCVIAGHVAAMRERFESMTRTNTPCPDMMRSISPSLDVFRNVTPSPDRLG